MNSLQRYLLYGIILFFSLHLIRDILQDLRINNILSNLLVKNNASNIPTWYWVVFSYSYVIEILGILTAVFSLKRKKFDTLGKIPIFLLIYFIIAWLVYWLI